MRLNYQYGLTLIGLTVISDNDDDIPKVNVLEVNKDKQDGPSLESSSYLNVSLRYLGPQDLVPWDPWTLGPLDLGTI